MLTKRNKLSNMPRGILFLLGLILLIGCSKITQSETQAALVKPQGRAYFDLFDTVSYIYSYKGDSSEEFLLNADEAYSVLLKYHRYFDIYHEYEGMNNLCTINSNPLCDISIDDELLEFLLYAKEMSSLTCGAFDISMGAVLKLWHDARTSDEVYLPSSDDLLEASRYIGFEYLEINEEKKTVRLLSPYASLDVGAVGKGYAAERASEVLRDRGAEGYVLNIGGNIRIIGTKPDKSGWRTGIKDPRNPDSSFIMMVMLSDVSCVTSGDYERYFVYDGKKYSHIIDPETLYPAEYYSSVTVITPDSSLADCLSTALFVLPYEESYALAEKMNVDVIWVFNDSEVRYTPGVEELIIK